MGKIYSLYKNLLYFKSFSKRCWFEKNVSIQGNVNFGNNVFLGGNVEVRNLTNEISYIGDNVSINRNTILRGKYKIGRDCAIGPNCTIIGANHNFKDKTKSIKSQGSSIKGIVIGNDVWIGANCVILDGVTIGEGSVIGAGSIVTKSIPPYSVAVGNPCKVIKSR